MNLKQKIIGILTAALVVGVMTFNVSMNTNANEQQMSNMTLKKAEAVTTYGMVECECYTPVLKDNECTVTGNEGICASGDNIQCDAYDSNCDT